MKKLFLLLVLFCFVFSCKKEETKNYVTFSGKITNKNSDSIVLSNRKLKFKKIIKVDANGIFKDTFQLKSPNFLSLFDGQEYGVLFLRNGDDVKMTLDTKLFDETITFEGTGVKESNFLAKKALMEEQFLKDDSLFYTSKKDFEGRIRKYNKAILRELEETESHDSLFLTDQDKKLESFKKYISKTYEDKNYILKNLSKGTVAPDFTKAYERFDGGNTSLSDLKGKYLYVELWTTWCGYCKEEMPHFKSLADKYKDKNVEFVGVSLDKNNKHDKWKEYVKEKALPGVQLFYNQDKEFLKKYRVSGVPRFILIDPDGKIINAEAPKPSDAKIQEFLDTI